MMAVLMRKQMVNALRLRACVGVLLQRDRAQDAETQHQALQRQFVREMQQEKEARDQASLVRVAPTMPAAPALLWSKHQWAPGVAAGGAVYTVELVVAAV